MSKISIVTTGDSLITQRLPKKSQGLLDIKNLLEQYDVRFTNLEGLIHNYESETYPSGSSGGDWIAARPPVLTDLKWLGFNFMTFANNHTLDWSHGGVLRTLENLDREEIVHAGVGHNLAEASAPRYFETPNGRVALVAVCSTCKDWHVAGEQRRDVIGRPGLNALRFETIHRVTSDKMLHLKTIAENTEIEIKEGEGILRFGEYVFEVGEPGTSTKMYEKDASRIENAIKEAARQADVVLVSHHTHETKKEAIERELPADFAVGFAHMCIDAGAHAYIGHGPHVLRGIEIYKEHPIIHGLGDFFFQAELIDKQPSEFYESCGISLEHCTADGYDARNQDPMVNELNCKCFETVMASFNVEGGKIEKVFLRPVTLSFNSPRSRKGTPILASVDDSTRILKDIQELSIPYGTQVWIEDGIGIIEMNPKSYKEKVDDETWIEH